MKIISGMHRSGTSLVARLFFHAGADLGDPETFYPADRWNVEGYFEQPEFHAVNMPLINGPWGRLAYFKLPSKKTILQRSQRQAGQIRETANRYRDNVVKETRFCLTLPAWLEHGAQIKRIIVCLRDPGAVVNSLRRRNWIPASLAYRLWTIHIERLLEYAPEISFWYVRYDRLVDKETFAQEVAAAFRFFDFDVPDLDALQAEHIKPALNHFPSNATEHPAPVKRLWNELLNAHAEQFRT